MNASKNPSSNFHLSDGEQPASSLHTPDIEDDLFYVNRLPADPASPTHGHEDELEDPPTFLGGDAFPLPEATATATATDRADEADRSGASSAGPPPSETNGEMRSGFTLRNYEDEINQLRKSNLNLKLRIYSMEQDRGLLRRPEEKENVFRVNLDLRVENETMKKELNEKMDLLRTAYEAIESLDAERLRERAEFESQISSLRQTIADSCCSQDHSCSNLNTMQLKRNVLDQSASQVETVGDNVKKAEDAFLPFASPDNFQNRVDELEQLCNERARQLESLEEELTQAKKQSEDLKQELGKETKAYDRMNKEFQAKLQELQEQTEKKEQEAVAMQRKIQESIEEEKVMVEDITHKFEAQICDLKDKLEKKELLLITAEENFKKSQLFIKGIVEANQSQVNENERMEKDIKIRDLALQKLRTEYDILKNKIRNYRAQGFTSDRSQVNKDQGAMGKLISELNEAKAAKVMLQVEVDLLKDIAIRSNVSSPSSCQADAETIRSLQSELQVLKADWSCCQARSMKAGANKALEKASVAYTNAAKDYTASMQGTLGVLRQRLVELIDFLQQLLSMEGEGLLDFSFMSSSMRDALHRSMEEGHRLSQSINQSLNGEDLNETQRSILGSTDVPQFALPTIEITFEPTDETRVKEYEALVEELRENVSLRIGAQKETEELRKKMLELVAKPLRRSRSLSRRRLVSSEKNDTDTLTFKTVRSCDRDSDSAWSQPDKTEARRRIGIRSNIPVKVDDSTQSSLENVPGSEVTASKFRHYKAKILQLQARLVSQEEKLSHETSSIRIQLAEATKTVDKLKLEKKNLMLQLGSIRDNLEGNIASLQEELEKIVHENKKLTEKVIQLQTRLVSQEEKLTHEASDIRAQLVEAKETVDNLKDEKNNLILQLGGIKSLQQELEKGSFENRQLTEKVQQLQSRLISQEELLRELTQVREAVNKLKDEKKTLSLQLGSIRNNLEGNIASLQQELEKVVSENRQLTEKVTRKHLNCNKVMFVTKENFEEQELALGHHGISPRKPLNQIQNGTDCNCQMRIEELERLLKDTKTLYEAAQEKIRLDQEQKQRLEKAVKKELDKTKKVLSKTRMSSAIQEM